MTGIIVKRSEFEFNEWLKKQQGRACEMLEGWGLTDPADLMSTEVGWLMTVGRFKDKPLEFDLFQLGFLANPTKFRSQLKSRQIGFSFSIACESVARCHIKDRHVAVCVSYNLDDAKEKIALAKELHDELPLEFQKKIVIDSKTVVGFRSNDGKRRISRIVSNPAKAPRGKSGDVYLDELAHCQNDRAIYAGATALISRSGGQLTIGSSPLGQQGLFYEIHSNPSKYHGYWRQRVPWWLCRHFSNITTDPDKIALAESLPTEVRVERYGTSDLIDQFHALPLEDFQQEFECAFQDERVAFFPYALIEPCCQKEATEIPVYDNLRMLSQVAGKLGPLYAGFDVGRSKHPSELHIFEKQGPTYILRFTQQYRDMPFPLQRAELENVCDTLGTHLVKFRIDETGLGKNLAEDLVAKYGQKIEPVTFTNPVKEELANGVKICMMERNLVLPRCRSTIAQIHSIKQKYTPSGNAVFDVERNRHHHADKFWSIALAIREKRQPTVVQLEIAVRVLGDSPEPAQTSDVNSVPKGEKSLMERVFSLPAGVRPEGLVVIEDPIASSNDDELEDLSKSLAVAMRVWKRSGDHERVREIQSEYKRVRREIQKRLRAG